MPRKPSRYYSTVLILCKPLQKLKNGKLTNYLYIFYSYILKFHKILRDFFCRPEGITRCGILVEHHAIPRLIPWRCSTSFLLNLYRSLLVYVLYRYVVGSLVFNILACNLQLYYRTIQNFFISLKKILYLFAWQTVLMIYLEAWKKNLFLVKYNTVACACAMYTYVRTDIYKLLEK